MELITEQIRINDQRKRKASLTEGNENRRRVEITWKRHFLLMLLKLGESLRPTVPDIIVGRCVIA